ncbi:MAG: M28 family peptidase [Phycisphaerales bacterium JB043]
MRVRSMSVRLVPVALAVVGAGCASNDALFDRRGSVSYRIGSTQTPVRDALDSLDADSQRFTQHVMFLSNPFLEGRAPGTHGIEIAASYLESVMGGIGLEPAFVLDEDVPGGMDSDSSSYRQAMMVRGETVVHQADVSWSAPGGDETLTHTEDFEPLGASASGEITAPVVFVGYAIEEGKDGYYSFGEDVDLSGQIAMVLRFEPMDEEGRSRWASTPQGWSSHAGLTEKIQAVADRGAEGVILVNPPGAGDPRARRLIRTNASNYRVDVELPMIAMTTEAADRFVRQSDGDGRSLLELRKIQDEGGGVVAFSSSSMTIGVDIEQKEVETYNVAGVLPGKGSLADEYVVVGAHYDHIGYGRYGARPSNRGRLHPGADDNASGTAGVLLIADQLSRAYAELDEARSVIFLLFTAEEMGLMGSKHFASEAPSVPMEQITHMINMDMIGRLDDNELDVFGQGTGEGFEEWLGGYYESSGFEINAHEGGSEPTDHTSFYREGVPIFAAFTGIHSDYHTPRDTFETVNYAGGARVASWVGEVALGLATIEEPFEHREQETRASQSRSAAARVRLGIVPGSYDPNERGVLIGEVNTDGPAHKAGIKGGDRIVMWNGEELANVMSYMEALSGRKPGEVVNVGVERDGRVITLQVTLEAWKGEE